MPATNPRINVVLERPVYRRIELLAKRDGVSLSLKMRDLVNSAIEMEEDIALAKMARSREKGFTKSKALKHGEIW